MRAFILGTIAALLAPLLRGQSPSLVITGGAVLDPSGGRFVEGSRILVSGGRIREVGPEVAVPAGAETLDLSGCRVVPGLIDLHAHLLLHPYDETAWDDQVLKESLELRSIRATVHARAHLHAGFTTLRDLGTEGAGVADVALRDAIERGIVPGPRIFATTRAIVATSCYAPKGFDPRWRVPQGAQEATGEDEVRRVVREQIALGADWIKVYADFSRRRGDEATPTFSAAELEALVDEAHAAGLPVCAHATSDAGVLRAVNAGVATIEHGYGATAETLGLMAARGVALCPTLAAAEAYARYFSKWKPGEPDPEDLRGAKAMFRRALASGVTIACGSDVGVFAHGQSVRELELMVACGMKPADALRAATGVAAKVLRREKDLGAIVAGAYADLVAVKGDPLADPGALRDPALVLKAGRVAIDRR